MHSQTAITINHKVPSVPQQLTSEANARIIADSKVALTRVRSAVKIKQSGLCRQCRQEITDHDKIVSRGRGNKYYYHLNCAKRLHII